MTDSRKHSIYPVEAVYYHAGTGTITPLHANPSEELDLQEICVFLATGFFLGDSTYYKQIKALPPGTAYSVDDQDRIVHKTPYWKWIYEPRDISFDEALGEFGNLLDSIVQSKTSGKKIILALSGGLDSRTLAAALPDNPNASAYSYEFEGGFSETKYGEEIAKACHLPFRKYIIPEGYLWKDINEMALVTGACAEFTHPRQVAIVDEVKSFGDTFLLGHGGDLLFDSMGATAYNTFEKQVDGVLKKITKGSGVEIAEALWKAWGLAGDFNEYLKGRVEVLLADIKIDHPDARIRAFKSLHWVPRWTNTNLAYFTSRRDAILPYFTDEMAQFITTVPEEYLAGRRIQIEYLKHKSPPLAAIPWQGYDPLNLYNYHKWLSPAMIPYRAWKKLKRILNSITGKRMVTRNWEIQFTGKENKASLEHYLFDNASFKQFIPQEITQRFYARFQEDRQSHYYSHSVSMLLTLSTFCKIRNQSN